MNLALFDFDGTISDRDSFLRFMRFVGGARFYRQCAVLSPRILLFLLRCYPNEALKQNFLKCMFKGEPLEVFRKNAERFCAEKVPHIIRAGARQAISRHQAAGDRVVVVTATPRLVLEPWCERNELAILGTELEVNSSGLITGRLQGENCRGDEKVCRIQASVRLDEYREIWAYGDTSGDRAMLGLATPGRAFYKPFR